MKKVERQKDEEKMHRTGFTPYFPLSKPDQILSKINKYILFFLQVSFENIPLH